MGRWSWSCMVEHIVDHDVMSRYRQRYNLLCRRTYEDFNCEIEIKLGGNTSFLPMDESFFCKERKMSMERLMPDIPFDEVLHYLGCKEADEHLTNQIQTQIKRVKELAKPKVVYHISTIHGYDNDLKIPLHGKDIRELLKTCDQVIFMAATLGTAIDVETKRLSLKDMGDMLVFDAVCNAGIEAFANDFQEELAQKYAKQHRYLTDRFSCGYGDLRIDIQKTFCERLDTKRKIGLFVNESSLLIPLKSITAMIGISDKKQEKRISGCAYCDLKDTCELRKRGNRCGA